MKLGGALNFTLRPTQTEGRGNNIALWFGMIRISKASKFPARSCQKRVLKERSNEKLSHHTPRYGVAEELK